MIDLRIREWEKLKYIDPVRVLSKLRQLQIQVCASNLDEKIKGLRTNRLRHHGEKRIVAIFCFGMSCILKRRLLFAAAPRNSLDYDVIVKYIENNGHCYVPLQLKEFVPERLNSQTSLDIEIEKLKKYSGLQDTVVVIHYNRTGKFRLEDVQVPSLKIAQLWILGSSLPDQTRWWIAGDMVASPKIYDFPYPTDNSTVGANLPPA